MRAHCDWGLNGVRSLSADTAVVVIVDVLSFSTCVDVATSRGAVVHPFASGDRRAAGEAARTLGAELAGRRRDRAARYSLSPVSLSAIPAGTRLLLPSPNGSAISAETGTRPTLAGCLRNARAVAARAAVLAGGGGVTVIPAGERWPDGSLRPAIEDLIGAGAVLDALDAERSPEAQVACDAFRNARSTLAALLRGSVSGRELIDAGFQEDVEIALDLNASTTAPLLRDGAYRDSTSIELEPT